MKPTSSQGESPDVRVGLAVRVTSARIEIEGAYSVSSRGKTLTRIEHQTQVHFTVVGDSVIFSLMPPGDGKSLRKATILPLVLRPLTSRSRIRWSKNEYRGRFEILPVGNSLTLINELDMEEYLRGVVPWEIGWHGRDRQAAVEAQAVAARTYAYKRLGQYPIEGFDLYADVQDQVYRGTTREDDTADQAIRHTRGEVLSATGELIDAYYSSTCGGHTSRVEKIWLHRPARAYLEGRRDSQAPGAKPYCTASRHFRWVEAWSGGEIEKVLKETVVHELKLAPATDLGGLVDLKIQGRSISGRVQVLEIIFTRGRFRIQADRIRWVLRPKDRAILRSTLFELEIKRQDSRIAKVIIRGGGNGHGVGMCQVGALSMSRFGYAHASILSHYYPESELKRMY